MSRIVNLTICFSCEKGHVVAGPIGTVVWCSAKVVAGDDEVYGDGVVDGRLDGADIVEAVCCVGEVGVGEDKDLRAGEVRHHLDSLSQRVGDIASAVLKISTIIKIQKFTLGVVEIV